MHANTVSAAYQDLAARGWVENRRGSGVYARDAIFETPTTLDTLVQSFLDEAKLAGFAPEQVIDAIQRLGHQSPPRYLVLHPDRELARILAAEIEEAVGTPIPFAAPGDDPLPLYTRALVTAASAPAILAAVRPPAHDVIRLRAMEEVIAGQSRRERPPLVAILTRSDSLREWCSKLISALGFDADSVLLRDPRQRRWRDGLAACDIVAADVVAARDLPPAIIPVLVRIVDPGFLTAIVTASKL